MQRSLLATAIIFSLSACDSDSTSVDPTDIINSDGITISDPGTDADADADNTVVEGTGTASDDGSGTTGEDGTGTADDGITTVDNNDAGGSTPGGGISDDAGSATSDGGETSSGGASDSDGGSSSSDDGTGSSTSDSNGGISDDAGSATSDGGETSSGTSDSDGGSSTSDSNGGISDDAGSATSDGGETSSGTSDSDGGSSTSDSNGGISDDAGSATSDGGASSGASDSDGGISDDAGSSSSDGGVSSDSTSSLISDDAPSDSQTTNIGSTGARITDAGVFASDNSGSSFIRRSTLSAGSQEEICTSLSDQNNFSDIRNVGDFILHNNAWRPFRAFPGYEWTQCINTNTNGSVVGWTYDWGPGQTGINGASSASGDFFVRSYPELIYGVKDEFRTSAPKSVTGLPVELSNLPNIQIDYSYSGPQFGEPRTVDASNNARFPNGTTISGERNVAVESFMYQADAAGNCSEGIVTRNGGSNHQFEVMVWLDAGAERLPAGPSDFVADLTIRGDAYKVYTKNDDPRYIAFVAQNPQTTGTLFWNDFTDWARENSHQVSERFGARSNTVQIQDDWCVANILVGTEIFWGAGSISISDWTITQTQ